MSVPHEFGEFLDDFGVVDVFLGGEAPECQVVVHQKHDKGTAASGDLKAFAKTCGQNGRAVDVFPYIFGSSGVVKNQGNIEGVGIGMFDDDVPVDGDFRVVVSTRASS